MKLYKFKSIQLNLTFWLLTLALMPLIVAMIITYNASSNAFEERAFAELTAIRDWKVLQVENWISERKGDFRIFAQNTDPELLNSAITMPDADPANEALEQSIRTHLHNYQKNNLAYEEIYIINFKTGVVDISTNPANEGHDKKNEHLFLDPIKVNKVVISPIYYSSETGKNLLTYSAPIYEEWNEDPKIIGVLVANIDLSNSLYPLILNNSGLGETGETLLVNKERVALNELRFYNNAPLQLKISAEPALYASQGKTGIIKSRDYRGVQVLAAYTFIPETNWGVVVKQDLSELNAPSKAIGKLLMILFIISAFVIYGIVYFVSKSISSPILNMNRVAQKIGAGDFTVRNKIDSDDELGLLAKEFNTMAEIAENKINVQKGISAISETMIGRSNMKEFGTSLLKRLMKISNANMGTFYIINEDSMEYEPFASVGGNEEMLSSFRAENAQGEFGNVLSTKTIFYLKDIPENTIFKFKTTAGEANPKEIITIPIKVENQIIAIISLVNLRAFHKESIEIIEQSWNTINTSYSNLIASERTRVLSEHLSMINQELEAQSEELQDQAEELQDQTEELQRSSEELQEQNLELEAQRIQVESANKLKSEFLSNMSHELRTPLNSIMALSRVLIMQAKEKLNDEEKNYLEIVERNGKRLLNLINSILDLSKIESGKMDVFPESISLTNLLYLIKENNQALAEEKNIALTLIIPAHLPNIETDEARLHQVLLNVVSNAVKFTKEGAIAITVKQDSQQVIIEIEDTGIGISKDNLPHIFDEFRQADGTSSRQYEGTGLGLAIANKLIQILGGTIKVKSVLGEGTIFTVTIPIKWNQSELLQDDNRSKSISTNHLDRKNLTAHDKVKIRPISKERILIVEDNPDAIIQLKTVLEKENYIVDIADGGQEALDYLKNNIPNGIILDLMMPNIDGFDVLNRIRNNKETKNIPILILTAKDLTKEDVSKLNSSNIKQLIHKGDVDIDGLLVKVKLMLVENSKFEVLDTKEKRSEKKPTKNDNETHLSSILVVEDNPDNMITIKAILKNKYTISEAEDGEQGFAMAQSLLPNIVLLDMSLPKMDGEDIVKHLKEDNQTKNILIIAVTAQAMKGDRERFIELGCDGYIPKPIDPVALLTEIDKLLNEK